MSDPGTTFLPTFSSSTNRFSTIPSGTLSYDANGNLTSDGFHTYGWDADGNLITVDGVTGTFDALDRRVEIDSSGTYSQMVYPPFAPTYQMALASGTTATGTRMPLPGGGEAIFNSAGLSQYRHPNWQGSQVALSWASGTPNPNWGGAFTAFGEKYAHYSSGYNGYFAGMLGIADEGTISDAYQAAARLYHQAEGRWVSPDPVGLGAVDFSNPQSWNRYAYVMNNPLSNTDPSGLCPDGFQAGPGGDGCVPIQVSPSVWRSILDVCGTLQGLFPNLPIQGCSGGLGAPGGGAGSAAKNVPPFQCPAYWKYSQSTGTMTSVTPTGALVVGTGYSGNGDGLNNPDMQGVPDTGPIPQGFWRLGPQQDNVTGQHHVLPGSMRLTANPGTNTFGRAGFLIHGDNARGNNSASEGCVILDRNARNQMGASGINLLVVAP